MPARNRDIFVLSTRYSGSGVSLKVELELSGAEAREALKAVPGLLSIFHADALNVTPIQKERFRWIRVAHQWVERLWPYLDNAASVMFILSELSGKYH